MHIIDGIDIEKFLKARNIFEEFRKNMITDRDKAGAVQAFEFCYELAWKTMKRILTNRGIDTNSPRDCFRAAAAASLISDPKPWFDFINIRNITVHTYDEKNLEMVISSFDIFSNSVKDFLHNLEQTK